MKKQEAIKRSLLPAFTERFIELFGESVTQEEFGNKLGLTRNTIAQYLNGHRIPDSITLKQICERCNVSADWLLGLSDVKKPDADLQAVSKITGFLPETIDALNPLDVKMLNAIYADKEKAMHLYAMFCDFDLVEMYKSIEPSKELEKSLRDLLFSEGITNYDEQKNKEYSVLKMAEFNILHAGRCAERIAETFAKEGKNNGKP